MISAAQTEVDGPLVNVSFTAPADAVSYRYELTNSRNEVSTGDSTAAPVTVSGLTSGANSIRVRAISVYDDESAWSNSVSVTKLIVYDVSMTTSANSITYGGASAVVMVTVKDDSGAPLAGKTVSIRYSYSSSADLATWGTCTTLTTNAGGQVTYKLNPSKLIVYVCPVVQPSPGFPLAVGPTISVTRYPYLPTPHSSSKVTHKHGFTLYGYIKPKQTNHHHDVKLKFYRYTDGTYKYYKTVTTTNHSYKSYTKYSVSTSLPYGGKWRVYAYYVGSSGYAARTTSGYKSITVK